MTKTTAPSAASESKTQSVNTRLIGLDAARGLLLVLGVVLHTANIYSTGGSWIIADSQRSVFFDFLISTIHEFRMPTFFWISGFFCALTVARSGTLTMLKRRLPRLAIPLIAGWITLNVAQEGFVAWWNGLDPIHEVLNGVPLFHLWFLVDLLVFIILAPIFLPWLRQISNRLQSKHLLRGQFSLVVGLGTFSYCLNLAVRASGFAYHQLFGLTSLYGLSINLPFFIGGALMYYHAGLKDTLFRIHFSTLLVFLTLALLAHKNIQGHGLIAQEFIDLIEKIMIWACIGGCLNLFNSLFKNSTWMTRLLADASYTVFLFSHFLIVVAGLLMTEASLPIGVKFLTVSLASLAIATLIHVLLIRRYASFRFCFNGH